MVGLNTTIFNPLFGLSPVHNNSSLKRIQGKRNLFNTTSKNQLTHTNRTFKKKLQFSNGSRPGNSINIFLPKSNISQTMTGSKLGANVVPPTRVENTYSRNNYNRSGSEEYNASFAKKTKSWFSMGGRRKTLKKRK